MVCQHWGACCNGMCNCVIADAKLRVVCSVQIDARGQRQTMMGSAEACIIRRSQRGGCVKCVNPWTRICEMHSSLAAEAAGGL